MSVRRHALTIVALFLALALGVVLGVMLARGPVAEPAAAPDERLGELAEIVTPRAVDEALTDRPVLVVTTPDAPDDSVSALTDTLREAGALTAGRVALTEKALDPGADDEITSLVGDLPLEHVPSEAGPGTLLGLALARAAMFDPTSDGGEETHLADDDRAEVMTTLAGAGFIDYEEGTVRPGLVAVVVSGDGAGLPGNGGDRVGEVARQVDADSAGAVVAAQVGGERQDPVTALRGLGDTGVSTVDNVAGAPGRLAVILALAEQINGGSGAYGLGGDASAALPSVPEP